MVVRSPLVVDHVIVWDAWIWPHWSASKSGRAPHTATGVRVVAAARMRCRFWDEHVHNLLRVCKTYHTDAAVSP